MEIRIADFIIECKKGDIASQHDIKAVVNAANAWLRPGGGVAGAIHRKAGPDLEKECRQYAPIKPGQAVLTSGYGLPARYVIHCLGPVYGVDKPEDKLLSECYINAMNLADQNQIDSVAFPAISTGAFGYPFEEASEIAIRTVISGIKGFKYLKTVRFVLFADNDLSIYESLLSRYREFKI